MRYELSAAEAASKVASGTPEVIELDTEDKASAENSPDKLALQAKTAKNDLKHLQTLKSRGRAEWWLRFEPMVV